ncbi:MAG: phosphatidylinositol-3-phosphatase, partial [Actinomycetota bacterium]|nr:phosphatidylinositol-3-phosphatase [Actinomycetota bacterium]
TPAVHQKVVVFAFENRTWSDVGGTQFDPQAMPYLHSLATQCATFADYTEPDTSQNSATQYVGTAAGNTANTVRDDCSPSSTCRSIQNNIFRQTRLAGKIPRSFVEGATAPCSASANAAKHVGALYFFGTYTDGSGAHNDHDYCTSEVRPYSEFDPNALPNFSFVTPTLCNDGHDCGNSTVDTWAAANVQPVLNSAAYKAGNVTVFIWYDEDHPVPNMKIGLHVTTGVRTTAIDYRTELHTWEDLLGVPRIDTVAPWNAQIVALPPIATALSQTIKWTATDNTGVKSYDVRFRWAPYNSSSYGNYATLKSATPATTATLTGTAGRTYCVSVRARDAAGNVGNYGPQSCVGFPVDERTMTAAGTWSKLSSSLYYASTAMSSTTAGSTLKLSVDYRRLYLIATKCSGCGTVNVYRGSTLLKSVSLNSSSTVFRVPFGIEASSTVQSGTVTIKQASAGHKVTIEGLGVDLG